MSISSQQMEEIATRNYRGVEGWLLCFCLILVFVVPMSTVYHVFMHTLPLISKTHDLKREILWTVYAVLFLGVAVFAFVAGIRLWMVCDGAVRLARLWLLAFLCAHVCYFFLWLFLFRHDRTSSLASVGWDHVVGPLIPFALWNTYLEHSKRVRGTYGAQDALRGRYVDADFLSSLRDLV